jgi:hypothetical protein
MERGSFAQEFIAGNFGGILGISIVYPLDTLKIRQQMNPNGGTMIHMFNSMRHADGVSTFLSLSINFICYCSRSSHSIVECSLR